MMRDEIDVIHIKATTINSYTIAAMDFLPCPSCHTKKYLEITREDLADGQSLFTIDCINPKRKDVEHYGMANSLVTTHLNAFMLQWNQWVKHYVMERDRWQQLIEGE